MNLKLISPFPAEFAPELWRWLNTPRGPNFEDAGAEKEAEFRVEFAARLRTEQTFALMAEDAEPVAFAGFASYSSHAGCFRGVVVDPLYRKCGVGTELLKRVWDELQMRGVRKALALFFADNAAIRVAFSRAGAVEEGRLTRAAMRDGVMVDMRLWSFTEAD